MLTGYGLSLCPEGSKNWTRPDFQVLSWALLSELLLAAVVPLLLSSQWCSPHMSEIKVFGHCFSVIIRGRGIGWWLWLCWPWLGWWLFFGYKSFEPTLNKSHDWCWFCCMTESPFSFLLLPPTAGPMPANQTSRPQHRWRGTNNCHLGKGRYEVGLEMWMWLEPRCVFFLKKNLY